MVIEQMCHYKSLGEAAFWALQRERDNESLHDLKGMAGMRMHGLRMQRAATCTDDGGVAVCGAAPITPSTATARCNARSGDDTEVVSDLGVVRSRGSSRPREPETDPEAIGRAIGYLRGYLLSCDSARQPRRRRPGRSRGGLAGPGAVTNYLCGYVTRDCARREWVRQRMCARWPATPGSARIKAVSLPALQCWAGSPCSTRGSLRPVRHGRPLSVTRSAANVAGIQTSTENE